MKSFILSIICVYITLTNADVLKFPQDPRCGYFFAPMNYGYAIKPDQQTLPWMVSVTKADNLEYLCRGVLIYPDVVITSANCVQNITNGELKVRANPMDYVVGDLFSKTYDRNVLEIHVHEKYKPFSGHNNFAILILSKPFEINELILMACLPLLDEAFHIDYCVKNLIDQKVIFNNESRGNQYVDQKMINASISSQPLMNVSCDGELTKQINTYALSCGTSKIPERRYYVGSIVDTLTCGPEGSRYQFYDTLYKFLPWIHQVMKSRFIYYDPEEDVCEK